MGMIADTFGGGQRRALERQAAEQRQATDRLRAEQAEQRQLTEDRERNVAMVEAAQRRVRSGRRRGLLAFSEDQPLGGGQ